MGRLGGMLAGVGAVDLGAAAVRATLDRAPDLRPDYILLGNVVQAGNGQNPARAAAVRGGVDRTVPGITLNDVCLASMSSVALADVRRRRRWLLCAEERARAAGLEPLVAVEGQAVVAGPDSSLHLKPRSPRRRCWPATASRQHRSICGRSTTPSHWSCGTANAPGSRTCPEKPISAG
jgi:Thiolase, N-terminal domain